ncbi:zinc transporter ZIP1-like [Bolinopsis microptera]|uniref:zinc transporter ZIP1-like n=1 Tax=Bolinopsis microptera TaxID=2820187 RepID=UPI003079D952
MYNISTSDHHQELPDLAAESRASIGAKCGGIVIMFILPFLFGIAPIKASKMKNAARFTSIASCFGGGVFFGTCFTHLIPEVAVEINLWRDSSDNNFLKSLPIAEILECIGFVSILLVESMVDSHGHGHSHGQPLTDANGNKEETVSLKEMGETSSLRISSVNPPPVAQPKKKSVGVLIFALAVHSVFEGLAIGVEAKTMTFIQLAGAILIHKCVVAFAVGTRLIDAGLKIKGILTSLTIFCISTPIGIAVAMGILETLASGSHTTMALVSGLIQGLSTGFFLYITFVEMICDEIRDGKDMMLKTLFLAIGVLIIATSTVVHNYSMLIRMDN